MKYYSLKNILKQKAHYNVIFGERSNGKTYAVLEKILTDFVKSGYVDQGAIIRRWDFDFKGKGGKTLFNNLVSNGVIRKLTNGQWEDVYFQSQQWKLCRYDENGKRECMETPIAYAFCLTGMEHDKSTSYPNVKTIMFDEFISRNGYITDEFIIFTNVLSTIIRNRDDVIIFMLGNTVNRYCPYFNEMGLKHIKQQRQGTIDLYKYGEEEQLKVAVEYTVPNTTGKPSDVYFAFDNPKLQMITKGEWEIDIYPHIPIKYKPKHVVFEFFINFDGEWLHADIVSIDNSVFIYLYPKKDKELKDKNRDLLFTEEYSNKPNIRRNILKPSDKLGQKIYNLIRADKIFYQSNDIGEVFRNYLMFCGRSA